MDELEKSLLSINYYGLNTDDILIRRSHTSFEGEWFRVYNDIEKMKLNGTYTKENKAYHNKVRENIFGKIYRRCGDGELAEYISSDFGLIVDSMILGYKDSWLDKLINCYRKAVIPTGIL